MKEKNKMVPEPCQRLFDRFLFTVATCLCLVVAHGCAITLQGNGVSRTERRKIDGNITGLKASKAVRITLVASDEPFVELTGDSNLIPHMRTELTNGVLIVEPKQAMNRVPRVTIAANNINRMQIDGASSVDIKDEYDSEDNVSVTLAGSSELTGKWNVEGQLKIHAAGASTVTLSGQSGSLDIQAKSASKVDLANLENKGQVDVSLNTASKATVSGGTLNKTDAHRASKLNYTGDCSRATIKTNGASKVNCNEQ